MLMFLSLLCISLLLVAVLSVMLYGVSPHEPAPPQTRPETTIALGAPQFFGDALAPRTAGPQIPIEVVIARVEHHVRLEQAAAESFLEIPAVETLHSPTVSRFVN